MTCACPPAARVPDMGMFVCTLCGQAHRRVIVRTFNREHHEPGRQPYSRAKRFSRLLANVWGDRVSCLPRGLIELLDIRKVRTVDDILHTIRTTSVRKFKRYDALAYLSREILGNTLTPLDHGQIVRAAHIFRQVERRHLQIGGCFPAYSWVIEKFLNEIGRSDLILYLHVLKCRKRRELYELMYFPLIKSLCEISGNADTHPNRLQQRQVRLSLHGCRSPSRRSLAESGLISRGAIRR